MRKKTAGPWVVYKMAIRGAAAGPNAVCEQAEWDEMERARPGRHALVPSGIASEGEAEHFAALGGCGGG